MTANSPADGAASPVRAYFDSDDYLAGNVLIPIRAEIVGQLLAHVHDGRVLDLGCGDGSISRPLLASGNELTLVDFSEAMLERARAMMPEGAPVEFVRSDIDQFEPAAEYDAVLCVGVLAHVPDVARALGLVAQSVRAGGTVVIQITDDGSGIGWLLNRYYTVRGRHSYRLNRISLGELCKLAGVQGLERTEVRRYGLLAPGLGRLPGNVERRVELAVARRPRLAGLAAELLISFRKR